MTDLHLHVKTIYFRQIESGEKVTEYRLASDHWINLLIDRKYNNVVIHNAFKPGDHNRLTFNYRGFVREIITHPHFGPDPVKVYAIPLIK